MKRLKVLVVSHGAALGGSPISALNIARYINKESFDVVYAFAENGPAVEQAREAGYSVKVIPKYGPARLGTLLSYLYYIWSNKIDVIHLNSLTSYYRYPAYAGHILRRPVAWFVRENPSEKRCRRLASLVNNIANRVVTVSHDTADHMEYVRSGLLYTIHNGVALDAFQPISREIACVEFNLDMSRKYITVVASIEPRKGVMDLVKAFHSIHEEIIDYDLLIVGKDHTHDGRYFQALSEYINTDEKMINRVHFLGETEKIIPVLSLTEVFVMPSYWEGLSRAILEAMSCGLPLLVSSNGGNKEQVVDGKNGYSFEAGDIKAMSQAMLKLLTGNKLYDFGLASRKMAEDYFDIRETTRKIERLYFDLTSR